MTLPTTCPECGNKWLMRGMGFLIPSCVSYESVSCKCGWSKTVDANGIKWAEKQDKQTKQEVIVDPSLPPGMMYFLDESKIDHDKLFNDVITSEEISPRMKRLMERGQAKLRATTDSAE